jgi:hypothetical protein
MQVSILLSHWHYTLRADVLIHQVDKSPAVKMTKQACPCRARCFPACYWDKVSQPVSNVEIVAPVVPMNSEATPNPLVVEEDITMTTKPNALGMFQVYPHPPTIDSDQRFDLVAVCDAPELAHSSIGCTPTWLSMIAGSLSHVVPTNLYHPLPNGTVHGCQTDKWCTATGGILQEKMKILRVNIIIELTFMN